MIPTIFRYRKRTKELLAYNIPPPSIIENTQAYSFLVKELIRLAGDYAIIPVTDELDDILLDDQVVERNQAFVLEYKDLDGNWQRFFDFIGLNQPQLYRARLRATIRPTHPPAYINQLNLLTEILSGSPGLYEQVKSLAGPLPAVIEFLQYLLTEWTNFIAKVNLGGSDLGEREKAFAEQLEHKIARILYELTTPIPPKPDHN